jgi:hypothetical protein
MAISAEQRLALLFTIPREPRSKAPLTGLQPGQAHNSESGTPLPPLFFQFSELIRWPVMSFKF